MEIISENNTRNTPHGAQPTPPPMPPRGRNRAFQNSQANTFIGVLFILAGAVWLLYNFNVINDRFFDVVFSWRMLLAVIGLYLLAYKQWVVGGVLTALGALFVLADVFYLDLPVVKVILPAAVIAVGVGLLLRRS